MGEEDALKLGLYFVMGLSGVVGVVTIPMLISEFYLLYVLSKRSIPVTEEALLGTFTALNVLLAVTLYSGDFNPLLPAVISALTFLVLAVFIEVGVLCEVRGR